MLFHTRAAFRKGGGVDHIFTWAGLRLLELQNYNPPHPFLNAVLCIIII